MEEEDVFSVYTHDALEILGKADEDVEKTRPIGGFCSTEDLDRQGEIVVAKGLDFSEFVEHGWFNDNHKQETSATLGYPRVARLEKGRWWTEGNLIFGYPPADQIWALARSLQRSGSSRRLGFSIEGKVLERDSRNKILRAKVRNVALTNCPVNANCTWSALVKSFAGPDEIERAIEKALMAGHQSPAISGGSALRAEELEGRTRNLTRGEIFDRVRRKYPSISDHAVRRLVAYVEAKET